MAGTSRLSEVARHVVQPDDVVDTHWYDVDETCERLGWLFDRWQDGLGRLILGTRSDGLYAADAVVVSIPRQVGKTYLIGAIIFALCLLHPGLTVIWTAHRTKTAKETFASMLGMAERLSVAPHVKQVVRARGDEAVLFENGSRVLFGAREQGFGRGFAGVDILVFDEAQILTEAAMEDMIAAQNVAPNPLTIMTGTPPRPKDPGEVFTMLRQEALDGESSSTLYVEISGERGADPMDRKHWRKANPSFPHRTPERAILRMRKHLSLDSFQREALGIWDEFAVHRPAINPTTWAGLADVGPPLHGSKPAGMAVDMSHGREISVGACWLEDDSAHVEEVWANIDEAAAVTWVTERAGRRIPVLIDGMSPAASMIPALKARGVKILTGSAGDMAKGCGLFVSDAEASRLTHTAHPPIDDALIGAKKRAIGTAGGWGWDRKDPAVNIAPLVAVTLARLAASMTRKPSGSGRSHSSSRRAVTV